MIIKDVYGCEPEELVCPVGYRFTDFFRPGRNMEWVLGNTIKNSAAKENIAVNMSYNVPTSGVEPRIVLEKL